MDKRIVNDSDKILCLIIGRFSLIWNEALNASINEFIPLVEKYKANIKPIERSPPLGLLTISSIDLNVISLVEGGSTTEIISNSVSCNPSIDI